MILALIAHVDLLFVDRDSGSVFSSSYGVSIDFGHGLLR
ncbi:hypothetical protein CASFOL_001125 [Castilleja foliolosa]|uniref:Uncharacterized protein n=1 Tax=Castilleja foliolosa TaxID=1961234 RepID=A0ABD3EQJ1_9LAMI